MGECPVCGMHLPLAELPMHAEAHFLGEDEPPPRAAAAARPEAVSLLSGNSDGEQPEEPGGCVQCPYGCGALVALEELDSHEEAHRLQDMEAHSLSLAAELHQQEEQQQFEQLQRKFGFSDQRPGMCYRCGKEGHWVRDCPTNPAAQASRQPLPTTHGDLARLQQPERSAAPPQPQPQPQPQPHLQPAPPGAGGLLCPDVIPLLRDCFEAQPKAHSTVYLSGPVGFHSSRSRADQGWGCGYRNIQMQASHLLLAGSDGSGSSALAQALFGGCGFVPDIPSLQAWLEVAWQAGFDTGGAAMFGGRVQGTRKWIGTTEAAALLRYFGCRALIAEFYGSGDAALDATGASVHAGVQCDVCGRVPIVGVRFKSYNTPDYDVCATCRNSPQAQPHAPFGAAGRSGGTVSRSCGPNGPVASHSQVQGALGRGLLQADGSGSGSGSSSRQPQGAPGGQHRHQQLAEWVWAYFSSPGPGARPGLDSGTAHARTGSSAAAGSSGRTDFFGRPGAAAAPARSSGGAPRRHGSVVLSGKPPLYLQHEGHSRTVVGIERVLRPAPGAAGAAEYSLVVLDPGLSPEELLGSLRAKDRWQMRVKRGLHSLSRQAEFQLLYVAPGGPVPEGPQRDALKVMAAERYRP